MLQEAVDALFDNGRAARNHRAIQAPLKSLSDMLKGKSDVFAEPAGQARRLLGRSVIWLSDSGSSVGLPKKMALELFKPFIYSKLEEKAMSRPLRARRNGRERRQDSGIFSTTNPRTSRPAQSCSDAASSRIQAFEPY